MRVHWTHGAIEHLLGVHERLAQDSLLYARQVIDRLIWRSEQVADFPLSGRVVPEYEAPDIRELIERPYRIIYRIGTQQIDVMCKNA